MLSEGYKEEKYEKALHKNLPVLFCLLLLTRQFDKAGVIPFLSIPLKEDFFKFHTPQNFTSTCSP